MKITGKNMMVSGAVATGVGLVGEVMIPTIASFTPYVGPTVVNGVVTGTAIKAGILAVAKAAAIGVGSGGVVGALMLVSHLLVAGGIGCFALGFFRGLKEGLASDQSVVK